MMWHAFRRHDGEVVGAGSGAIGKRYKLLWM